MNRNDKILIGVLLVIALGFTFVYQGFVKTEGSRVVITIDGEIYKELPLNQDTELLIEGAAGRTNHLVIADGKVKMDKASCPDLVCVYQRAIAYSGESIICLPNKVVVKIVDGEEQDIDAVQ